MQRLTLLVAGLLVLAACGAAESSDVTSAPDVGTDTTATLGASDEVLLEIGQTGGFVMVEFNLRRVPLYVVMSDGTVYRPAPSTEQFPGPALPEILRYEVDESVMSDVRQYVSDMGLSDIDEVYLDEAAQRIADAPDTYVTYFDDAGEHTLRVYALGMDDSSDARAGQLNGLIQTLDEATASGGAEPYVPDRLEVYAVDRAPADPEFASTMPWPLEIGYDELTASGEPFPCVLLEDEQAERVTSAFDEANELTLFDDGTADRGLVARPLFDHQASDCRSPA